MCSGTKAWHVPVHSSHHVAWCVCVEHSTVALLVNLCCVLHPTPTSGHPCHIQLYLRGRGSVCVQALSTWPPSGLCCQLCLAIATHDLRVDMQTCLSANPMCDSVACSHLVRCFIVLFRVSGMNDCSRGGSAGSPHTLHAHLLGCWREQLSLRLANPCVLPNASCGLSGRVLGPCSPRNCNIMPSVPFY